LLAELKHFVRLALDGRTVRPLNTAKLGIAAYKRDAISEMGKRVGLLSGPMEKLREQWRRYYEAQEKLQLLQVIIATNESEPPASA